MILNFRAKITILKLGKEKKYLNFHAKNSKKNFDLEFNTKNSNYWNFRLFPARFLMLNLLLPAFLSRNFRPWKCFCKASWMTSSSDCTHCPSAWGSESSWGKIRDTGSFRILTPLGISWTNDFMQLSHHQTASRQLKRAKKGGKLQFEFSRQKLFSKFSQNI